MAQSKMMNKVLVAAVVLSGVAAVSAQVEAPAPSPDVGAAFSLPASAALLGASLLFSLLRL
ncbi:hypothetical protein DCAR_0417445 [Daucus carota subsp. sativus]|uniref:Uncharacterized protein n=1 Tax=Daucus carota subsp. sativus TaxID=79200 RepID=A0A162AC59_DAUCS|nr:hypothetical protein DCAR_0417445 [Daucus carota subsp. sativus]